MAVTRNSLKASAVGAEKLADSIRKGRYCFDQFSQEPLCWVKGSIIASSPTGPAGTALTENCVFTGKHTFEYQFIGDNTDAFVPTIATDGGYNWGATTELLDRGVEINFAGLFPGHPRAFVSGTDEFFARVYLNIEDVSGANIFFGFRKQEAYAAALATYTDIFGIQILGDSSSAAAAVNILTNLNDATDITSTATSETLADGISAELEVRVKGRTARFYWDGVELVPNTTFTIDSGDVVIPVLWITDSTDLAGAVKTLAVEIGPLADRVDATLNSLAGATA